MPLWCSSSPYIPLASHLRQRLAPTPPLRGAGKPKQQKPSAKVDPITSRIPGHQSICAHTKFMHVRKKNDQNEFKVISDDDKSKPSKSVSLRELINYTCP